MWGCCGGGAEGWGDGLFRTSRLAVGLAALGSVEDDPGEEVVAEVFEAVVDAGADEGDVAGDDGCARAIADKVSVPLDDDVDFVAGVGLLAIDVVGGVEARFHGAVGEGDGVGGGVAVARDAIAHFLEWDGGAFLDVEVRLAVG